MLVTALTVLKFLKLSLELVNIRLGLFCYTLVAEELVIYNMYKKLYLMLMLIKIDHYSKVKHFGYFVTLRKFIFFANSNFIKMPF